MSHYRMNCDKTQWQHCAPDDVHECCQQKSSNDWKLKASTERAIHPTISHHVDKKSEKTVNPIFIVLAAVGALVLIIVMGLLLKGKNIKNLEESDE